MGLLGSAVAHLACRRNPVAFHAARGVRFGRNVDLLDVSPQTFGSEPYLIEIDDDVTISAGVRFITHDGGLRVIRDEHPGAFFYAPIRVGAGAFLGAFSILLPGAVVGERAVIGAGSVVSGEVPDGWVAAGVPARQIRPIEEYAAKREGQWVDTRGLSEEEKRGRLQHRVLDAPLWTCSPPFDAAHRRG